jgi:hypothetical protein
MYIMLNHGLGEMKALVVVVGSQNYWHPAKNCESGLPHSINMLYAPVGVGHAQCQLSEIARQLCRAGSFRLPR